MTVGIIATIKVKPGREAEFETVFRELAGQVKQNEPGCLLYDLFRSKTPSTYVVMEQYASAEALAAHGKTAHFVAAGPKLGAVLDGRPVIDMLEKA
jgi:quinol monooxygenase YgiN